MKSLLAEDLISLDSTQTLLLLLTFLAQRSDGPGGVSAQHNAKRTWPI
jgi:hypothetical protein